MGTMFRVAPATPAEDSVAVRLPPWVGRKPAGLETGTRRRAVRRQQRPDGQPEQSTSDPRQRFATGADPSRAAARRASPEKSAWATPSSAARPGFPVQRSPAVSPQKLPAAAAAEASEPADMSPEHTASGAAGTESSESTDIRQDVSVPQSLVAEARSAEPSAGSGEAEVDARTRQYGTASSVPQPDETVADTAAAEPMDSSMPHSRVAVGSAATIENAAADTSRAEAGPTMPQEEPFVALSSLETQTLNSLEPSLPDTLESLAEPAAEKTARADSWDGHDAALLAVIVEHAKVLRTINAGEAGSSCSLM